MSQFTCTWDDAERGTITIHAGPAKGSYRFSIYRLRDGRLDLGTHDIGGKRVQLKVDLSDKPALRQELESHQLRCESEAAVTPCTCDRCGAEVDRGQATLRRVNLQGWKTKLPYCPECARFLWETEDGFGESAGSVEPADRTPYHKEQDY